MSSLLRLLGLVQTHETSEIPNQLMKIIPLFILQGNKVSICEYGFFGVYGHQEISEWSGPRRFCDPISYCINISFHLLCHFSSAPPERFIFCLRLSIMSVFTMTLVDINTVHFYRPSLNLTKSNHSKLSHFIERSMFVCEHNGIETTSLTKLPKKTRKLRMSNKT